MAGPLKKDLILSYYLIYVPLYQPTEKNMFTNFQGKKILIFKMHAIEKIKSVSLLEIFNKKEMWMRLWQAELFFLGSSYPRFMVEKDVFEGNLSLLEKKLQLRNLCKKV